MVISFIVSIIVGMWFLTPAVADEFSELAPTMSTAVNDLQDWIVDRDPVLLRSSQDTLTSGAFLLASALVGGVLALFLTCFMVKDGPRVLRRGRDELPEGRRGTADRIFRRAWRTLGPTTRTTMILKTTISTMNPGTMIARSRNPQGPQATDVLRRQRRVRRHGGDGGDTERDFENLFRLSLGCADQARPVGPHRSRRGTP